MSKENDVRPDFTLAEWEAILAALDFQLSEHEWAYSICSSGGSSGFTRADCESAGDKIDKVLASIRGCPANISDAREALQKHVEREKRRKLSHDYA